MMHVAREGAPVIQDVNCPVYQDGKLKINFSVIVSGLLKDGVGESDKKRSPGSRQINLSFKCTGHPISFSNVKNKLGDNANEFLAEVGRIAEFVCESMVLLQDEAIRGSPIMADEERDSNFAKRLRTLLFLSDNSPMRAEMVAVCNIRLTGTCPKNLEHRDKVNPQDPEYNHSGTFNAVVKGEDEELYLLK